MALFHWTSTCFAWFLLISSAQAQGPHAPDPLFQSNELLEVRIVAPMTTILVERPIDGELPGTFQYTNTAGETVEFDIKLRTRGKSRRDKSRCNFPPLRLNFVNSQTKGTLFEKQDKVKLVTHCQNIATYREALLREYSAYRILNVLTEVSFKVRLMRITYVDTEGTKDNVRYGFAIEHRDRLAKRIEKAVLNLPRVAPKSLHPDYAGTISMYHYLIGNTDFSSVKGPVDDMCCHNHVLFGEEGEPVWSVPYDFDQAGLVNAPYAAPNPRFKLPNVRRRLYRGRCIHNDFVKDTVARYQNKRDDVLAVVHEVEAASKRSVKPMTRYIEKFYKTLDSDRKVNSAFIKECI